MALLLFNPRWNGVTRIMLCGHTVVSSIALRSLCEICLKYFSRMNFIGTMDSGCENQEFRKEILVPL